MGSKSINMNYKVSFIPAILLLLASCASGTKENTVEKWKKEIVKTEKEFSDMAGEVGIPAAFILYAADDAVVLRGDQLVVGKSELIAFYQNQDGGDNSASLTWEPDFVDVSSSGDLGYTYGRYTYSYIDSTGATIENRGIFHTVWKRQPDGSWRFVWD
jgi:ketosteroid isomerase-like protein